MKPETARLLVGAMPAKLTIVSARAFLETWLRAEGHQHRTPDAWYSDDDHRREFGRTVVRQQEAERDSGGRKVWKNLLSTPLLAAAWQVASNAHKTLGNADQAAHYRARIKGRSTELAAGLAKSARQRANAEQRARGIEAAYKFVWDAHRDELRAALLDPSSMAPERKAELEQSLRDTAEMLATLVASGSPVEPDGSYASADRPPLLPFTRNYAYNWTDPDGAAFAVHKPSYQYRGEQSVVVHLFGRRGGSHTIDAAGNHHTTGSGSHGEVVLVGKDRRHMVAVLTFLKELGDLRWWCKIVAGYGLDVWYAEDTERNRRILTVFAKRGRVTWSGDGKRLTVRCR